MTIIDDYTIGISFISWMLAIWMLMGFFVLKSCESESKKENGDDNIKDGANSIIDDYNGRNFAGRVVLMLQLGFTMTQIMMRGKGE